MLSCVELHLPGLGGREGDKAGDDTNNVLTVSPGLWTLNMYDVNPAFSLWSQLIIWIVFTLISCLSCR